MAKRSAKKSPKKNTGRYTDFKLHGSYPKQKVLMFVVVDCLISLTVGVILQPYIVSAIASVVVGH